MSRRDGTGPLQMGLRTGRGFGVCAGEQASMYHFGSRRGVGRGLACRHGFGRDFALNRTSSKTKKRIAL